MNHFNFFFDNNRLIVQLVLISLLILILFVVCNFTEADQVANEIGKDDKEDNGEDSSQNKVHRGIVHVVIMVIQSESHAIFVVVGRHEAEWGWVHVQMHRTQR